MCLLGHFPLSFHCNLKSLKLFNPEFCPIFQLIVCRDIYLLSGHLDDLRQLHDQHGCNSHFNSWEQTCLNAHAIFVGLCIADSQQMSSQGTFTRQKHLMRLFIIQANYTNIFKINYVQSNDSNATNQASFCQSKSSSLTWRNKPLGFKPFIVFINVGMSLLTPHTKFLFYYIYRKFVGFFFIYIVALLEIVSNVKISDKIIGL